MHTSTLYAILCLAVGVAPSFALPSGSSANERPPKEKNSPQVQTGTKLLQEGHLKAPAILLTPASPKKSDTPILVAESRARNPSK
ncbi:hypothetical protein F5148DRAFT_702473 [Russula earlei]|uniref:Uncharacterized protein n=1 Tax=Russula earlei TaxID=71964 RepID=A0ACC0UDH4_9AGAM|nr:hypothetical protein F5148DRAFT_702473 [Russula earlei]